jgi:hypothetical protein
MVVAKIWKFFDKVTVDGVIKRKCLKCNKLLPTPKDSSTSNMINHLEAKGHAEELKAYNDDDKKTVFIHFISIRNIIKK